jgi:hypothetical protein
MEKRKIPQYRIHFPTIDIYFSIKFKELIFTVRQRYSNETFLPNKSLIVCPLDESPAKIGQLVKRSINKFKVFDKNKINLGETSNLPFGMDLSSAKSIRDYRENYHPIIVWTESKKKQYPYVVGIPGYGEIEENDKVVIDKTENDEKIGNIIFDFIVKAIENIKKIDPKTF